MTEAQFDNQTASVEENVALEAADELLARDVEMVR